MVARIRSISSGGNTTKYFYFLEKNYECSKGWQVNKVTKELGLDTLTRESLEDILNGKISSASSDANNTNNISNNTGKETSNKVSNEVNSNINNNTSNNADKSIRLGRKTKEGLVHHPGQELTLSAPKSVSIMSFVAEDKRLLSAHERAVSETLEYIDRHLIYSRVQKDGIQSLERTDNTIVAKFTHMTSRGVKDADNDKKPDPQLHTHCLIANATKCKDGGFRSIVFDKLYENQLNISELYRIELARNIKELGYNIETSKDKAGRITFEIEGISKETINEFSQRRQDILEIAEERGIFTTKGLEYIAKSTREEKVKESQEKLLNDWKSRVNVKELDGIKDSAYKASQTGLSEVNQDISNDNSANKIYSNNNLNEINSGNNALSSLKQTTLADNLSFAIAHLSEREAVWDATELHKTMWQKSELNFSIKDIEEQISNAIESNKVLTAYDENNNSYTTRQNLKTEKEVIELMQEGQNSTKPIVNNTNTTYNINKTLNKNNLSVGQKDAIKLILTNKDRVVGVQGSAGTGKTTMLKQVKNIAEKHNYELLGLAPTKSASEVLSNTIGIESRTLRSFTMQYEGVAKGRGTKSGIAKMKDDLSNKLVILDEASLASSKEIRSLLTISKRLDFKVAMIGDAKQQHGVEAGKPFYYLQEHGMNTAIQRNIKRQ